MQAVHGLEQQGMRLALIFLDPLVNNLLVWYAKILLALHKSIRLISTIDKNTLACEQVAFCIFKDSVISKQKRRGAQIELLRLRISDWQRIAQRAWRISREQRGMIADFGLSGSIEVKYEVSAPLPA
jgi:hypothetical protein